MIEVARVFCAPDKFKGTLTAKQAAAAMVLGSRRAFAQSERTQPECVALPMADGGEGSLAALAELQPELEQRTLELQGAGGQRRFAAYLHVGREAYFESARLLSLRFSGNRRGNIFERSSAGLGEWCHRVLAEGADRLFVFLGGTAVCDGGFGAFRALGARFEDRRGGAISTLADLQRAARLQLPEPQSTARVTLLCDVQNPLTGPRGAAALFAPQKGATPDEVRVLEERLLGLEELARLSRSDLPDPLPNGVGAGGGIAMPFLVLFPETRLESGTQFFLGKSRLAETLRAGDIVLTGEGRTDLGTLEGKLVDGVVRLCQVRGVTCRIISGSLRDEDRLRQAGYPAMRAASEGGPPSDRRAAAELLVTATRDALLEFLREGTRA